MEHHRHANNVKEPFLGVKILACDEKTASGRGAAAESLSHQGVWLAASPPDFVQLAMRIRGSVLSAMKTT